MSGKLVITEYRGGIAAALFKDDRAVELSWEERAKESLLGNIYVGKVAKIVKNIQAAFVEIEGRVPCYYSLENNPQPAFASRQSPKGLCAGDELLVQVSREGVKTKAPTVTSALSLSGKYLVLTWGDERIGVSSKLSEEQRRLLSEFMEQYRGEGFGWIVRTNAGSAAQEEIAREAAQLQARFREVLDKAPHSPCRTCLYRSPSGWTAHLKNSYSTQYDQILMDDEELFREAAAYLAEHQPEDLDKLTLYKDRLLPLGKLYPVERAFEGALRERVWLRSGAYLVIQPTEALVSIDVNTGKCEAGKRPQETFLKINLEAAREIARQLRLRNLSGMILIDFINLRSEEDRRTLFQSLDAWLKEDPVKACAVDMTALGLVEVTRKRVQKSLAEQLGRG